MKEYVKSKGVHCPNCGRSRGVSLWIERHCNPPDVSLLDYRADDNFIYCKTCMMGFRFNYEGIHAGYGSVSFDEIEEAEN